jgi:hypothetical protein
MDTDADDPFVHTFTQRDNGAAVTSSSGTNNGPGQSSRLTDVGGGADAHINKVFDVAAQQRLTIGGFFMYDAWRTTYGAPTVVSAATSANRNIYTLGGGAQYNAGNTYFGGGIAGELGNGSISGTASSGGFNSNGYVAALYVGRVFSLFNTAGSSYVAPPLPTKSAPRPATGYVVNLDLSGHLAYGDDRIGGFADSAGNIRGTERLAYGDVGGKAKLYWILPPWGRTAWSPYVAATVDQWFAYSHTVALPGDTLFFGSGQTFGGAQVGLDLFDVSGVRYGIQGYYAQSQEYQYFGGQAYVKFPLLVWLGVQPVTRH